MFSVATIFLVAFALNMQDAVFGQSNTTVIPSASLPFAPSSYSSSSTTPTNSSTQNTATMSYMPHPQHRATTSTTTTTTTTSLTPSKITTTTGTTSRPSVSASVSPQTPSEKICASVTATLKEPMEKGKEEEILRRFFNEADHFREVNITNLNPKGTEITFSFCLEVISNGKVGSSTESQLKKFLKATEVTIKIFGVEITDWKVVGEECNKCSDGGGGPITIKGTCKSKEKKYSCKGVEDTTKTTDCTKYCSGVVSFMVSYLLVSVGIALSLSFYL